MWRIVVLVAAVLLNLTFADVKSGADTTIFQRLKRSPHYDNCPPPQPPPPPFWHHHPPFWGAPPPPPFRGPPPPPPFRGPPPPPPPPRPEQYRYYPVGNVEGNDNRNNQQPCSTCGDNGSSAVSNAESVSGQAVAVAIARAKA